MHESAVLVLVAVECVPTAQFAELSVHLHCRMFQLDMGCALTVLTLMLIENEIFFCTILVTIHHFKNFLLCIWQKMLHTKLG
jgi:hypothetical protein